MAHGAGARRPGHAAGGRAGGGTRVTAAAWGPGAAWLLETLPALLGAGDDQAGFAPAHPLLREMAGRHPGARVGRSGRVLEALIPAILEQKVVGAEARRAWHYLLRRFGQPAPGPGPGRHAGVPGRADLGADPVLGLAPGGRGAGARPHDRGSGARGGPAGGDRRDAARRRRPQAAVAAGRRAVDLGRGQAARLRRRGRGSVGDYHLPAAVGWALAGRVVDDAGMLQLLAPYAGHRYRATRLVELSGVHPPRRGPRLALREYRAF